MNTVPKEYINEDSVPMSRMEEGVKYSVSYDLLLLDSNDRLWIRQDHDFTKELGEYDHEDDQVFVTLSERVPGPLSGLLTVIIPVSLSKKRKWTRNDCINPDKYRIIDEIVVP